MGTPLDVTDVTDRVELLATVTDYLVATEAVARARAKLVRLARRIAPNPTATDEEVVPAAYRLAREMHAEVMAAAEVKRG